MLCSNCFCSPSIVAAGTRRKSRLRAVGARGDRGAVAPGAFDAAPSTGGAPTVHPVIPGSIPSSSTALSICPSTDSSTGAKPRPRHAPDPTNGRPALQKCDGYLWSAWRVFVSQCKMIGPRGVGSATQPTETSSVTLQYKWLDSDFATAAQIAPADVAAIAAAGFRSIVNNRPDHEGGPAQPTSEAIEREAQAAGLAYTYLPVKSAMQSPAEIEAMETLLERLPKPVLGFCRSGTRTANLFYRARAKSDAR